MEEKPPAKEIVLYPIGYGQSLNSDNCGVHPERVPKVFLSLITNVRGEVIGFEAKPDETPDNYSHCWCSNLLQGLQGCNFGAHMQTSGKPPGKCHIIIDNEHVDGGRLFWEIPAEMFEQFRAAIHEMHIKANLVPYITRRLKGTDGLPFFDGFQIVKKDLYES